MECRWLQWPGTHPGGGGGCVWRGPSSAVSRCRPAGPGRGLGVGYSPLYGTPDCWHQAARGRGGPGGGYHAALGPGSRGGTPPGGHLL